MRVIDPAVIAHAMDHPARGKPWSTRELAAALGCSHATLAYLRKGERKTVSAKIATKFSEAVGCETAFLFVPSVSTGTDTTAEDAPA